VLRLTFLGEITVAQIFFPYCLDCLYVRLCVCQTVSDRKPCLASRLCCCFCLVPWFLVFHIHSDYTGPPKRPPACLPQDLDRARADVVNLAHVFSMSRAMESLLLFKVRIEYFDTNHRDRAFGEDSYGVVSSITFSSLGCSESPATWRGVGFTLEKPQLPRLNCPTKFRTQAGLPSWGSALLKLH